MTNERILPLLEVVVSHRSTLDLLKENLLLSDYPEVVLNFFYDLLAYTEQPSLEGAKVELQRNIYMYMAVYYFSHI